MPSLDIHSTANPVDLHIAREIDRRRKVAGVTQVQLARTVGVSFQQLQKYETAQNRVAASRLYLIAHALGCAPGDFFPAAA